jgi:hypothetical protein
LEDNRLDLRGRIDLFQVTNIFQLLHLAQATGKLVLTGPTSKARVYFHQGNVIYARTDAAMERIGDHLVRKGVLEPSQLEGAKIKAGLGEGKRIGAILVESSSITEHQLQQAVTDQIKEVIYQLVGMEEGTFAFYSQIYPENEDILLDVSLDFLLVEGLRRLDELRRDLDAPA